MRITNNCFKTLLIIVILALISCQKISKQPINLNQNWEFKNASTETWYPAAIPGSIHTDLLKNNLIRDPFIGNNENALHWIDTCDWIYRTTFKKPEDLKGNDHVELIFDGLDTYADVYLNDSLLFSANNMFVKWKKEIEIEQLKSNNALVLHFKSTIKEEQKNYKTLPYELPGGSRVFTRKAAYQYGWDWAPTYVSGGIWQNIKLHYWNTATIRNLQTKIDTLNPEKALISIKVEIESDIDFNAAIKLECQNQKIKKSFDDIPIKKGTQFYELRLEIEKPNLWWVHNLGKPYLYKFEASIQNRNKLIDKTEFSLGLRTIELIRDNDEPGETFYFKLNGVPVFMKGANYVPQSSFPGTVKDSDYRKIVSDAKAAHMNMLRVWGGGIYEKDIFYDLCDSLGILVWQDFMFANAMYPGDSSFMENIKQEAEYQVKRLNNHPSIAVWCGNNEMDEAWHNWGWSGNYSKQDSTQIWNDYQQLFHSMLPEIVQTISPEIPYTSSSPIFGRGNPRSSFEGDNHYWYVWHDGYDFDWYNKVTGRFMSEFGFQSFPSTKTIELFDTSTIKITDSEIMLAHQKHPRGNTIIKQYMATYYPVPDDFNDFIYVSQLLQAEGIRTGILAQRRAKPFCMGSLYWQLNDCWPAISWSSIDYSGQWKALNYFASQDFKNILISSYITNDSLEISVVSDSLSSFPAEIQLKLMNFNGHIAEEWKLDFAMSPNSSQIIFKTTLQEILGDKSSNNHFLNMELTSGGKMLATRTVFFEKPKDLKLESPQLDFTVKNINTGYEITITSKNLIKNIYLELPFDGFFTENYFDVIPGIPKKVLFESKNKNIDILNKLKYNSLNFVLAKSNP